jgi:hypothetical protein
VPPLPTDKRPLLFQAEPRPVTVTAPCEPMPSPIAPVVLLTCPPFATVSVPTPLVPTDSRPLLVQVEPAPVTVTVPWEPAAKPTKPLVLLTCPPFAMVSVPTPLVPTDSRPLLVQVEPAPVTVTAPREPTLSPISVPDAAAAPPAITVALDVIVLICTRSAAVGTALVFQLPGANQLVDVAPVQNVCAATGGGVAHSVPARTRDPHARTPHDRSEIHRRASI